MHFQEHIYLVLHLFLIVSIIGLFKALRSLISTCTSKVLIWYTDWSSFINNMLEIVIGKVTWELSIRFLLFVPLIHSWEILCLIRFELHFLGLRLRFSLSDHILYLFKWLLRSGISIQRFCYRCIFFLYRESCTSSNLSSRSRKKVCNGWFWICSNLMSRSSFKFSYFFSFRNVRPHTSVFIMELLYREFTLWLWFILILILLLSKTAYSYSLSAWNKVFTSF